MEDENSIELSLGLACGGSTSKAKGNDTDYKAYEVSTMKQPVGNLNIGQQNHENFWNDLGQQPAGDSDAARYRELWVSDTKVVDVPEEKSGSSKRKMPFEDIDSDKRLETIGNKVDAGPQNSSFAKKSNISANCENDPPADPETVAESEGDASGSWLMSKRGDISNSSEALHFARYSNLLSSQGNTSATSVHESCAIHGNLAYGGPLSLQPPETAPVQSTGPSKALNAASIPESSRMSSSLIKSASTVNNDHMISMKSNDLQLAFGYPSVQLPTLETGSSWMLNTKASTAERKDIAEAVSDAVQSEASRANPEEALKPSLADDENNESTPAFRSLQIPSPALVKGFPHEGSSIRPGAAPGLKFGGCGSFPDLPWVSVTGSGPNGKTISGVTYKFSKNQIKIVCACHGTHLSPEEFIQHADAVDAEAENNVGLSSFPSGNPPTSTQS